MYAINIFPGLKKDLLTLMKSGGVDNLMKKPTSHLFDPKSLEGKEKEIVIQLFLPCFDQSDTNDLPRLTEALDQLGSSRPLSDKTTFIHHHKCDNGESRKSIQRLQR